MPTRFACRSEDSCSRQKAQQALSAAIIEASALVPIFEVSGASIAEASAAKRPAAAASSSSAMIAAPTCLLCGVWVGVVRCATIGGGINSPCAAANQ